MQVKTLPESLKPVLKGFRQITKDEQAEYLKFFNLLIEKQNNKQAKRQLLKFKTRLEKVVKING